MYSKSQICWYITAIMLPKLFIRNDWRSLYSLTLSSPYNVVQWQKNGSSSLLHSLGTILNGREGLSVYIRCWNRIFLKIICLLFYEFWSNVSTISVFTVAIFDRFYELCLPKSTILMVGSFCFQWIALLVIIIMLVEIPAKCALSIHTKTKRDKLLV